MPSSCQLGEGTEREGWISLETHSGVQTLSRSHWPTGLHGNSSFGARLEVLPEGSLRIQPVLAQDAGHYLCLASNSAGSDRQGHDLRVFGRWTREGCTFCLQHPVLFGVRSCLVSGLPQLSRAESSGLQAFLTMKPISKKCWSYTQWMRPFTWTFYVCITHTSRE